MKPELTGDGQEYYLMLESFYNHQSPDLRYDDILSFTQITQKYEFKHYKFSPEGAYSGYFQNEKGDEYSYHFWLYPLINLPVKIFLHTFQLDPLKVFQITNALLFSIMIFFISRIKLSEVKKLVLVLIAVANPVVWFVFWSHPEIFCYSLIITSIVLAIQKKYTGAILLSALASSQNLPLIIIPAIFFGWAVIDILKSKNSDLGFQAILIFKYAIFVLPALFSPIFYLVTFGTISLIEQTGGANSKLISIQRVYELIFDLNIGVFPYIPIIFLISAILFVYLLIKKRDLRLILLTYAIGVLIMLALSSSTTNWNHGTTGPTRYVLWSVIPFIFLIFYLFALNYKFSKKVIVSISIGLIFNAMIIGAVFLPGVSFGNTNHSYLATFVLDNFPAIYSPTYEIFAERTLGDERIDSANTLIIYADCKKILYKGEYVDNKELCKNQD